MKKSSIWKLLFSALTVFAVAVFAGCTDDNDDMGAPYLNVTPENLTFDAEGQPADEYNGTFIVETNRPWRAIVEDEQTWVRLSATEGEGDAAVTVTVPASNIGQSAKVTFEVYNSYGALIQKDVNVLQVKILEMFLTLAFMVLCLKVWFPVILFMMYALKICRKWNL